ncbi:hypothetical protein KKB43_03200 [Patescibacteria group bacterium]|nr:hypothetical protein [Patescibacteria group bacterium]MBU4580001.1 hypothetical protein [Patescibacteria group bacterium]
MKIEAIKNINITALFLEPFNHLLISQKELFDLFKTNDKDKDLHTFVEAPGLKVLIFPNLKKEIVFEGVRVLINDKSETPPEESKVLDDFKKIIDSNMVNVNKLAAYGFNYDVVVVPENDNFKISDLVGSKIAGIENIKNAGVNILFDKDNITYMLEIKPVGKEKKFVAHFNAHFSVNKLPDNEQLKKQISEQFEEFKKVIKKI